MDRIFLSFLDHFLPFYPTNNRDNQHFAKMKKAPGHIIILQMCTISDNLMMCCSWDMEYDWQIFLVILDHFLPFTPSNNPENENFEKMKNIPGDIITLYTCTRNKNHILYGSWGMEHDRHIFFIILDCFCPFIPLTAWKSKIFTKSKKVT